MTPFPEGRAIIYCDGGFNTTYGKTAHGLVRFTKRYEVISVVDSRYAGNDAGQVLDGKPNAIPVYSTVEEAFERSRQEGRTASHFIIGLAPDGGKLSETAKKDVIKAISIGLNIDSGLHDYLSEDPDCAKLARKFGVILRDIRKPPPRSELHFFSGKIDEVTALKIAILGTDSAVGKRTTAWLVVQALNRAGHRAEMIGTGQTSWLQGVRFGIIIDTLVNDFVAGEIEHVVWKAWKEGNADIVVIEGQGSLLNPAYPGGYEILAAGRPDIVILQHAPSRKEYDGFPGYPLHPLPKQIQAIEMVSDRPVVAITINHENIPPERILSICQTIHQVIGLPTCDVLIEGAGELVKLIEQYKLRKNRK